MKNNFQNQINGYIESIGSKMDGAIAAYLAGVNIKKGRNEKPLYFYILY